MAVDILIDLRNPAEGRLSVGCSRDDDIRKEEFAQSVARSSSQLELSSQRRQKLQESDGDWITQEKHRAVRLFSFLVICGRSLQKLVLKFSV